MALAVLLAAAVTDVIDGWVARRYSLESRFGAYADPIADKLLLTTVYLSLGVSGDAPVWFVALVLARDVFILLMAGYGLAFTTVRRFPPSIWGKLSTFAQIATGVAILTGRATGMPLIQFWGRLLPYVAAVTTVWSGLDYARKGWNTLAAGRAR